MKEIVFFVYSYEFLEGHTGTRYYEIIGKPNVHLKIGDTLSLQKEMCKLEIVSIICYRIKVSQIPPATSCRLRVEEKREDNQDLSGTFIIYRE